jgi:hypothetical protein
MVAIGRRCRKFVFRRAGLPTILNWDHVLPQSPRYLLGRWPAYPAESEVGLVEVLRTLMSHPRIYHFISDTATSQKSETILGASSATLRRGHSTRDRCCLLWQSLRRCRAGSAARATRADGSERKSAGRLHVRLAPRALSGLCARVERPRRRRPNAPALWQCGVIKFNVQLIER